MHLKRASAAITVFCASFGLVVETISVHAQERVSPDKQWEYQYSDGVGPQIVKAGSICETRQEIFIKKELEPRCFRVPDDRRRFQSRHVD